MKYSKQREMILNEVLNSNEHPTADNIYDNLKKDNPSLSLGTVYRNLTQLENHGMIKKLAIPGDPIRYDCNLSEHDHFICDECGTIIDIEVDSEKLSDEFAEKEGVTVRKSYVILKGICSSCAKK